MISRVFRGCALACVGVAVLALVTAMPGDAASTAEWRFSYYPSSVNGGMDSVAAISRTDAWAVGGTYHGTPAVSSPYVLQWNGTRWSTVSIPGSSGYNMFLVAASSASSVWVLGTDVSDPFKQEIFRYDGSHWHTMSVPEGHDFSTLVVLRAGDVWVSGQIGCSGPTTDMKCRTDVWQRNGTTWLAHPINSDVYNIAGSSATNIWAVGLGNVNQNTGEGAIAAYRWTGTRWFPVAMSHPKMSGWPAVTIGSASDIWIAGWRGTSSQVLALRWTGSKWQQVISSGSSGASPDLVPYGTSGVWMGPWALWTGRTWVNTAAHLPWADGGIPDFVKIPGTSGSYWGAASAEKSANSAVDHPAMVIYGPVP